MRLAAGTRLGAYEILAGLGAGGMGEVYRALDTTLHREVAVKVLHAGLCDDADSRARLRREGQTLGALNHPHVAIVHDLGEQEGICFLVMELVPGETLEETLRHQPLPVPDALRLCGQIAAALEAAHDQGIVHRDLKPANIKVTPTGTAKVLDFGLAKVLAGCDSSNPLSRVQTLKTGEGVIVGTAAYMSPEQARGQPLDRRTDVWAFGCIVFEMLTGRRAFGASTVSDAFVRILEHDPDWALLPTETPPGIHRLLRRCLQKDFQRRLRDMGDARLDIEEALAPPPPTQGHDAVRGKRTVAAALPIITATAVGIAAGIAITVTMRREPARLERAPVHFTVPLGPNQRLAGLDFPAIAISPDGSHLAYVAARGASTQLFLRPMNGLDASPVTGAADAISPFFSPDSRWLAFFAAGKLKKVPVAGGPPTTICDVDIGFGGTWGIGDRIVFASTTGSPLFQVPAAGGKPVRATALDKERGEFSHRWPELLPDGEAVLFTVGTLGSWDDAEIVAQSLATNERKTLIKGGTHPRYLTTGHLLYVRAGVAMIAPFDTRRLALTGPPVRFLDHVLQSFDGASQLGVSASGTIVFAPGTQGTTRRLITVEPPNTVTPFAAPARAYSTPRLSPDSRKVLVTITGATEEVWMYDITEDTLKQLTFDFDNAFPVWTPDGGRVTFSSNRAGAHNLYLAPVDGSGAAERLATSDNIQFPGSWSPDGSALAFVEHHPDTGRDVWMLRYPGRTPPVPFVRTRFDESSPRFSPDGRWVAYVSNESGRAEVYVQAFENPARRWQVSADGGLEPVWGRTARELFYRTGSRLMAVTLGANDPRAESPRVLVDGTFESGSLDRANYDVASGATRFVMIMGGEQEQAPAELHVLLHWLDSARPVTTRTPR